VKHIIANIRLGKIATGLLVISAVYVITLLAWPAFGTDPNAAPVDCKDTGAAYQNQLIDCGSPKKAEIGGGLRYMLFKLQDKPRDPASDTANYFFLNEQGDYFRPLGAMQGSLVTAVSVFVLWMLFSRIKQGRREY